MLVDYIDAYERHRQDAEMLFVHNRLANADQLFGLAAECGLKAVLVALGKLQLDPSGMPPRKYQVHIDEMWDRFRTLAQDRQVAKYVSLLSPTNPFSNWCIHQRYVQAASFTEPMVQAHRSGMVEVSRVVDQARWNGILP